MARGQHRLTCLAIGPRDIRSTTRWADFWFHCAWKTSYKLTCITKIYQVIQLINDCDGPKWQCASAGVRGLGLELGMMDWVFCPTSLPYNVWLGQHEYSLVCDHENPNSFHSLYSDTSPDTNIIIIHRHGNCYCYNCAIYYNMWYLCIYCMAVPSCNQTKTD